MKFCKSGRHQYEPQKYPNGKSKGCVECNKVWQRNKRLSNPEKAREQDRQRWVGKLDKLRDRNLRRDFGITLSQYNDILVAQNEVCAICKCKETTKQKNGRIQFLSVDHSHITKKIRGLLCNRCNRAIGLLRDSIEVLHNAIKYLIRSLL